MPVSRGEVNVKRWRIWRLRFTVRTLAIFVMFVCAYIASWEATKKYGVPQKLPSRSGKRFIGDPNIFVFAKTVIDARSPAPLVLVCDEQVFLPEFGIKLAYRNQRRYYLWLFGPTITLPFESEWK